MGLLVEPLLDDDHLKQVTKIKQRIIFQVKSNPFFSPEINGDSILSDILHIEWYNMA